jgi:hypothetical protein
MPGLILRAKYGDSKFNCSPIRIATALRPGARRAIEEIREEIRGHDTYHPELLQYLSCPFISPARNDTQPSSMISVRCAAMSKRE